MKKLIISMVMAACCTGFAGTCGETYTPDKCAFGYTLKVMVRTTQSSKVKTSACDDGTCFRAPAIRRLIGVVYGVTAKDTVETGCGCGETAEVCKCNDWLDTNIAMWDYDTRDALDLDSSVTELIQLNRIGYSDRSKAEMVFKVASKCKDNSAEMTFAGFGLCGNHNGAITVGQMSGYCAGQLPAVCGSDCACGTAECGSSVWALCSNDKYYLAKNTAAYGKWTMVWNQAIAEKVGSSILNVSAATPAGFETAKPVKFNSAN